MGYSSKSQDSLGTQHTTSSALEMLPHFWTSAGMSVSFAPTPHARPPPRLDPYHGAPSQPDPDPLPVVQYAAAVLTTMCS